MSFFRCPACDYTFEGETLPTKCPRCQRQNVTDLPDNEALAAFDAGDICHCPVCQVVHSGDIKPRVKP